MKRTTVFLPEGLERDLHALARRERKPVAWFVREALTAYVGARRPAAQLPSFVGIGDSGTSDVAERHEELLWREPHEAPPRRPRTVSAKRSARSRKR